MHISLLLINTNAAISLMLLVRTLPNFEDWLIRSSVFVGNCLGDIRRGNICPCNICPRVIIMVYLS